MYYQKLKSLVESGSLKILLIVAPPRSGSTLMEKALSFSPSVDFVSHEPFMSVGYSELDSNFGYKSIIENIDNEALNQKKRTLVIKDMAHWLASKGEHKNFLRLIRTPILVMIRNPLLSIESRIKKVVQAISINPRISTQRYILETLARDRGYTGWIEMKNRLAKRFDISLDSNVSLKIANLDKAYHFPSKSLQKKLLDYFAGRSGFSNWDSFIHLALETRNYNLFEEVLHFDEHRFSPVLSGWRELSDIVSYLEVHKQPFFIVDSTQFRLDPKNTLIKISDRLNVRFVEKMIEWKNLITKITPEQERPQDLIWYDTLMKSTNIKSPFETCPRLADFPLDIRENLMKVDLPIYFKLFKKAGRIQGPTDLCQKYFLIKAKKHLKLTLTRMGIRVRQKDGVISVTIQDIDPIFSALYNPLLLKDRTYSNKRRYYKKELSLIRSTFDGRRRF